MWEWSPTWYAAAAEGCYDGVLAVCTAHKGAHPYYLVGGDCVELPPRRAAVFEECRVDPDCSLPTYIRHSHPVRQEIVFDEDAFAASIVRAAAASRKERSEEGRELKVPSLTRPTEEVRARYTPKPALPPPSEDERKASGGFEP